MSRSAGLYVGDGTGFVEVVRDTVADTLGEE